MLMSVFCVSDVVATGKPDAGQKIIYAYGLKTDESDRLSNPHLPHFPSF